MSGLPVVSSFSRPSNQLARFKSPTFVPNHHLLISTQDISCTMISPSWLRDQTPPPVAKTPMLRGGNISNLSFNFYFDHSLRYWSNTSSVLWLGGWWVGFLFILTIIRYVLMKHFQCVRVGGWVGQYFETLGWKPRAKSDWIHFPGARVNRSILNTPPPLKPVILTRQCSYNMRKLLALLKDQIMYIVQSILYM